MGKLREEMRIKKHPRVEVMGRRLGWAGRIQRMRGIDKESMETYEGGRRRRSNVRRRNGANRSLDMA